MKHRLACTMEQHGGMRCMIGGLALALAAGGALASGGCVAPFLGGCTDQLVLQGLYIEVSLPPQPARYRLEIEAEGETLRSTYEVSTDQLLCVEGCGSQGFRLQLDPAFLATMDIRTLLRLRGKDIGPERVTVRVYRADALVASGMFEPEYEVSEPRGRGCGEYVTGLVVLEVPAP